MFMNIQTPDGCGSVRMIGNPNCAVKYICRRQFIDESSLYTSFRETDTPVVRNTVVLSMKDEEDATAGAGNDGM